MRLRGASGPRLLVDGLCFVRPHGGITRLWEQILSESIQGLICQCPDPPQRMGGRDSLLDRDVGEQGAAALLLTSHLSRAVGPLSQGWTGF